MSVSFHIIKSACALKITSEKPLTDGEALYEALYSYNPYTAARVGATDHDPRINIDLFLEWLVSHFPKGL